MKENTEAFEKLINMDYFETINISSETKVIRVPGGWIYTIFSNSYSESPISTSFVPVESVVKDAKSLVELNT